MSEKSTIEWTDATWNPVTGCTKISAGCKNCYAERVFNRVYPGRLFGEIRAHENRILDPLRWCLPRRIFVNSLSDLFHEEMPPQLVDKLFAVMALASRHTFQILTKRPDRMAAYFDLSRVTDLKLPAMIQAEARIVLTAKRIAEMRGEDTSRPHWGISLKVPFPNVWLGVSVEDQKTADERIPILLQTPAAVRFVSYEPAIGPAHLRHYLEEICEPIDPEHGPEKRGGLDWVIAGGESGPGARPSHPNWFRSIRDQCQAAGVPFFFKQWGAWLPISEMSEKQYGSLYRSNRKADLLKFENQGTLDDIYGRTCKVKTNSVAFDGSTGHYELREGNPSYMVFDVGKKRSGRLLDGREWNEYPKPAFSTSPVTPGWP